MIRYWRADMKGPWALAYDSPASGTGMTISTAPTGWLVSVGIAGRCAGIGWAYKEPREVKGFTKELVLF